MASYEILDSQEDLDGLFSAPESQSIIIFKHSLTCPISSAGLRQFERFLDQRVESENESFVLIQIQRRRDLSNRVAEVSGVRHESPQALLLKKGRVEWHASHSAITAESLTAAMEG